MKFGTLIASAIGSFVISTAAMAADPVVFAPPPPPMAVAAAGYYWAGAYGGAAVFYFGGIAPGAQAGFNFVRGSFVFGVEAFVRFVPGNTLLAGIAKAGIAIGPTDRVLVYGGYGFGTLLGGGSGRVAALGVAFGINERLSAFAELSLADVRALRAGVNFHFGN